MQHFILRRKSRVYRQGDSDRPKIHIKPDTYALLASWATETGISMTELTGMAVNYAAEHLLWEET